MHHHWLIAAGLLYLLAIGICFAVIHYNWKIHLDGCGLCNRYGSFCICGYSIFDIRVKLDKVKDWIDKSTPPSPGQTDVLDSVGIVFIVVVLPIIIAGIVVMSHIFNPWHRRTCLADLLSSNNQTI